MCGDSRELMRIDLDTKNYYIELDGSGGSARMYLKRYKAGVKDHGSINLTYDDMDKLIDMLREMQECLEK